MGAWWFNVTLSAKARCIDYWSLQPMNNFCCCRLSLKWLKSSTKDVPRFCHLITLWKKCVRWRQKTSLISCQLLINKLTRLHGITKQFARDWACVPCRAVIHGPNLNRFIFVMPSIPRHDHDLWPGPKQYREHVFELCATTFNNAVIKKWGE